MSEPTTVTYDLAEVLKRIEDKIDSNQKETNNKFKDLESKIDKQSEEIATIKGMLQGQQPIMQKIPDLAEKVGELKNWRQFVIITLTATVSGVIGWFIRGGNLKP